MIEADLAVTITKKAATRLRPASAESLAQLQALGVPPNVIDFYRAFEPSDCAEIADVRLWPIAEIIEENRNYVPGADLFPHGLVVFATTICGDAFCFDLSEQGPPVVLMSHELGFGEMDSGRVRALRKQIAPSFEAFLASYAEGTLDREPLYE